jgi:hypothetical protein
MENEAALLYAQSAKVEDWVTEERGSYDVDALHQEYRESLFSEKAVALLDEEGTTFEV